MRTGPSPRDFLDLSRYADATARLASLVKPAVPNALVADPEQVVPEPS